MIRPTPDVLRANLAAGQTATVPTGPFSPTRSIRAGTIAPRSMDVGEGSRRPTSAFRLTLVGLLLACFAGLLSTGNSRADAGRSEDLADSASAPVNEAGSLLQVRELPAQALPTLPVRLVHQSGRTDASKVDVQLAGVPLPTIGRPTRAHAPSPPVAAGSLRPTLVDLQICLQL